MAGRGAKFQKYYETKGENMSITHSIETTLGTGHRLANRAVVPILPSRQGENDGIDKVGFSLKNMWEELEQDRRSNSVVSQEAQFSLGDSGETDEIDTRILVGGSLEENVSDTLVEEQDDGNSYGESNESNSVDGKVGCNVFKEKNNDSARVMLGVKQEQKYYVGRKGRGRPKYRGNLA